MADERSRTEAVPTVSPVSITTVIAHLSFARRARFGSVTHRPSLDQRLQASYRCATLKQIYGVEWLGALGLRGLCTEGARGNR